LELVLFVLYIQRRRFSGNTPVLPNKPANIPRRIAVPKTKTQMHPTHNTVNITTSKSAYTPSQWFRFSDWQLPFLQFVVADLPGRFCTAIANVRADIWSAAARRRFCVAAAAIPNRGNLVAP
jgi:hypothetical protein